MNNNNHNTPSSQSQHPRQITPSSFVSKPSLTIMRYSIDLHIVLSLMLMLMLSSVCVGARNDNDFYPMSLSPVKTTKTTTMMTTLFQTTTAVNDSFWFRNNNDIKTSVFTLSSSSSLSPSSSTMISLRGGGGGDSSSSMIVNVMRIHRFVALAIGLSMICIPVQMHFGLLSRTLEKGEILTLRAWGVFVLFLAHVLQISLDVGLHHELHVPIAKGLFATFAFCTALYMQELVLSKEERTISTLYVIIFGTLASMYGFAILKV